MGVKAYWKQGSKFSGDPTKVYNELERIKKKNNGVLVAGMIVHESKRSNSPLHKHIRKLGVEDAAEEHYLSVARKLIGSIEVVREDAPEKKMRAYEVVTQEAHRDLPERKVYRSTEEIMSDPAMRDELLARAIRDAIAYRRKYHDLQELSQVFVALDEFLVTNKAV